MSKTRNVILILAMAVLLCSTIGLKALYRADVPLPASLGESNERSYLEGRVYSKVTDILNGSFVDGTMQDAVEDYVADAVPARDGMLMASAALQRAPIWLASDVFNIDVVPMKFGSTYVYLKQEGRMSELPNKLHTFSYAKTVSGMKNNFEGENAPRFFLYVPQRPRMNIFESGASLVSNGETAADIASEMGAASKGEITVIDSAIDSYEEVDKSYYLTDHHWNMYGAYHAYRTIADSMGFGDDAYVAGEYVTFDAPLFRGSYDRNGLTAQPVDRISDYEFDLPSMTVKINGKDASYDDLDSFDAYSSHSADLSGDMFINWYGRYFHSDYYSITITNNDSKSNKKLLIIGDSYSNCIERLFLAGYKEVTVVDPRYIKESLSETLSKDDYDDALILLCDATLRDGRTRNYLDS